MVVRTWALAARLAGALTPGPTAYAWTGAGWHTSYGDGSVIVPPDRSSVEVCDGKVDGRAYKAVWMNDNKLDARRQFEVRAPQGRLQDRQFDPRRRVGLKIRWGLLDADQRVVWEKCGAPTWAEPKPDHMK